MVDTVQPNFQLRKGEAGSGEATSVTCDPAGKDAVQVGGQAIPAGSLTMLPVPLPSLITRTSSGEKRATRDEASRLSVIVQKLVLEQPAELKPRNVLGATAVALAVTVVRGR